ncbi:hypothetical protein, partial [Escherichia coli]|uniref:hypothetical protein n=1 Tax=Escherichia coli TaxID=562 RepID=UPI003F4610B9
MPAQPFAFWVWSLLLSAGWAFQPANREPSPSPEVQLEDLRPGLLATYRSMRGKDITISRTETKPSFCLGHSSIHS